MKRQLRKQPISKLLIVLLCLQSIRNYHVFTATEDNSYHIIAYEKAKHLKENVYEDRVSAHPFSIALSDGVGGWKFPSSFAAEIIVNSIRNSMIKVHKLIHENSQLDLSSVEVSDIISSFLINDFSRYIQMALNKRDAFCRDILQVLPGFINIFMTQHQNLTPENQKIVRNNVTQVLNNNILNLTSMNTEQVAYTFGGAGTIVGSYIVNPKEEVPRVQVYQGGDSLFMLMSPLGADEQSGFRYYGPNFISDDMQLTFNAPIQFSSADHCKISRGISAENCPTTTSTIGIDLKKLLGVAYKKELDDNLTLFEFPMRQGEMLILGSDGLFDNLSAPVITIFFNYVMWYLESSYAQGKQTIENPESILNDLVDELVIITIGKEEAFFSFLDQHMNSTGVKKEEQPMKFSLQPICDALKEFLDPNLPKTNYVSRNVINRKVPIINLENKQFFSSREFSIQIQNQVNQNSQSVQPNKIQIDPQTVIGSASMFIEKDYENVPRFLRDHNCDLIDFFYYPLPSQIKDLNSVVITPCIEGILAQMSVQQNYLDVYGYHIMAKALAGATKRMSQKKEMMISPFAVRAFQFGRTNLRGVKEDDIAVIVSGIKNIEESEAIGLMVEEDNSEEIFRNLNTAFDEFLSNTIMIKDFY